jgi:parallel beta-helix repeat protein
MTTSAIRRATAGFAAALSAVLLSAAGPLNPPAGAVTPTAKPLAEIEPRTPIDAANTPGDADSLFRITAPGSYYLTGNVTGVSGKHGIEIGSGAGPGVTIDLNGFTLIGVTGALDGVSATATVNGICIRNGTVRNWPGRGINLGSFVQAGSLVADIRAISNTSTGISLSGTFTVLGCVALSNGGSGISGDGAITLTGCTATSNSGHGFSTSTSSLAGACSLTGCTALSNGANGFSVGVRTTLAACAAARNTAHGFQTGDGCVLTNCSAGSNGVSGFVTGASCTISACAAEANGGSTAAAGNAGFVTADACTLTGCISSNNFSLLSGGAGDVGQGYHLGDRCLVSNCNASRNRGHGFALTNTSRISGCVSTENGGGSTISAGIFISANGSTIQGNTTSGNDVGVQVSGSFNTITGNTARANGTDWVFISNNVYGPVVDRRAAAGVLVNGFSAASTMGTADPFANISY